MKIRMIVYYILICIAIACGQTSVSSRTKSIIINPDGKDIFSRFNVPEGYKRIIADSGSFSFFLQHFPLKEHGAKVYYYNGEEKSNAGVYEAVLDIDVGEQDLQQCADAVMRLRAEYLYSLRQYDKIHFNFTNGFNAEYTRWAEGERIKVNGNKVSWYSSTTKDYSANTFSKYLEKVFMFAGTLSLSKELKTVSIDDIQIGDVFIHGGSPGHAIIVMDMAINSNGKKIFMVAQSYMPAQSIHVLKNFNNSTLSPWYDLSAMDEMKTPEWTFEKTELKRFEE